jgi:hypothetical protein
VPKIFRAMRQTEGKPEIGPKGLGVRLPPDPHADIVPDDSGQIHPGTGGMSVSPTVGDLPARLIPARLRHLYPKAAGRDDLFVWSMGSGDFSAGPLAESLALRPDPEREGHGFVEPDATIATEVYVSALAATRDEWTVDENG